MKIVVYWSVYDGKFMYFDKPVETVRANGFGYRLLGYTYKTQSVPAYLDENNRKRISRGYSL